MLSHCEDFAFVKDCPLGSAVTLGSVLLAVLLLWRLFLGICPFGVLLLWRLFLGTCPFGGAAPLEAVPLGPALLAVLLLLQTLSLLEVLFL